MAYFTHDQETVLRALLIQLANETNSIHAETIKQHGLVEAAGKNARLETTREDVYQIAENDDIILTDEQEKAIAYEIISRYDHSDYNEFISTTIEKVLNPEEEE